MSYFEFPHSRSYDGDLGYIIKRLDELTQKYGEFMEYNQIKFADPVEWNINTVYPAWNIVFANNGYYIAVKPVPAGIMYNNTDYWQLIIPFDVDSALNTESLNPIANSPVARRFNQVSSSISNVVASLQNEGRQREEADTALDIRVTNLEEDTEHLSGALSNERTTRETTDTSLSRAIDTVNARLDNIAQTIVPGGTSGDAELADIRVGANGFTYANAGTAVRSQISVLNDAVGEDIPLTKNIIHESGINQTLSQFNIALPAGTKITIKTDDANNTGDTFSLYVRYSGAESNTTLNNNARFGTAYNYTLAHASEYFSMYTSGLNSGTAYFNVIIHSDDENTLTARLNAAETIITDDNHSISDINASLLNNTYNTASKIVNTSAHAHDTVLNLANTQTDISIPANCNITITMSDENVTGNGALYVRYTGDDANTLLNGNTSMNGSYSFINTRAITFFSLYKNDNVTAGTMNITIEYNYLPELLGVPLYYVDHIINKTAAILDNMMTAGKNGETFIFITDLHWENNDKNSPALVKYLLDNLNINYILCGGDLINEGLKVPMAKTMVECIRAFNFKNTFLPCAFGNHDSNKNGENISYPERWFDAAAQYALMQKQAENKITYFTDSGWNFYFDSQQTMTRWIICDTTENGSFSNYDELCALLNSTPSGYKIIISGHWFYSSGTKSAFTINLESIIDAYNARSSVTISGVSYDFSNASAEITFVIGGHIHNDVDWTTTDGIPFILSDCDNGPRSDNTDYPYVKGTVTEQSFDVVTVDYTNQTVKCVRIGRGEDRNFTF